MSGSGVPLRELALVILVAAAFTYLTTGVVRSFLVRTGRVAEIRLRDAHTQPTPRMGGVAMFTGFAAAIFLAAQLPALTRGFMPVTPEMSAVMWAALAIVLVGVADDYLELGALIKLFGQLFAAALMSGLGLTWTLLFIPFGGGTTVVLDQIQSTLLTAFFTVLLINAINFVDGLDGLAAGLGLIAAAAICMFSLGLLRDQGGDVSYYPRPSSRSRWPARASDSCRTTSRPHGSSWATPARCSSACSSPPRRSAGRAWRRRGRRPAARSASPATSRPDV